jgi:hypothetical protein
MTKVGVTQCQSNGGLFMTSHRAMCQVTGYGNSHRRLSKLGLARRRARQCVAMTKDE